MNRIDIYRQAIKRTFADLYGVSPDTVDVSWTTGKIQAKHFFIRSSASPMRCTAVHLPRGRPGHRHFEG